MRRRVECFVTTFNLFVGKIDLLIGMCWRICSKIVLWFVKLIKPIERNLVIDP